MDHSNTDCNSLKFFTEDLREVFVLLQIKDIASITHPPPFNIKTNVRREPNISRLPVVLALFETTELQLRRHQNWATVAQ